MKSLLLIATLALFVSCSHCCKKEKSCPLQKPAAETTQVAPEAAAPAPAATPCPKAAECPLKKNKKK